MKIENKQANPTIHYSFMMIIVVIMKIVGHFMFFTLAALANTSYGAMTVVLSLTYGKYAAAHISSGGTA